MMGTKLVQRTDYILEAAAGRNVLHLGCTNHPYTEASLQDGSLLHARLAEVARELSGMDSDGEGLAALEARGFTGLHESDLESLSSVAIDSTFDVIIAGEIVEHLSNPGLFLAGVKRFMDYDSRLVVTTVNAFCAMRTVQYALRGRGGVAEPVHPDHVAYYSYRTLKLLLERAGFEVVDFAFYDLGKEHRPYTNSYYRLVNDIVVKIARQLADGVIMTCKLRKPTDG